MARDKVKLMCTDRFSRSLPEKDAEKWGHSQNNVWGVGETPRLEDN